MTPFGVVVICARFGRHFPTKSRKIHLSNCVENVTILPGTADTTVHHGTDDNAIHTVAKHNSHHHQ
jgi:hypothetical protein